MGFLPLLSSFGKSGNRIINRIFTTFAIIRQKWQKDELWDFCHFCHHAAKVAKGIINRILPLLPSCGKSGKRIINRILPLLPSCGKSGKRMNYGIFATFAIIWQKWQKDN